MTDSLQLCRALLATDKTRLHSNSARSLSALMAKHQTLESSFHWSDSRHGTSMEAESRKHHHGSLTSDLLIGSLFNSCNIGNQERLFHFAFISLCWQKSALNLK